MSTKLYVHLVSNSNPDIIGETIKVKTKEGAIVNDLLQIVEKELEKLNVSSYT
jgi:hypothetical protein